MSDTAKREELGEQSPYVSSVDRLLDHYSSLVEYAQTLAFPLKRRGITESLDMTKWSRLRRLAFKISSPSLSELMFLSSNFVFLVWLITSLLWILVADLLFKYIFGIPPPLSSQSGSTIWEEILARMLLVLMLALIPAAYWRWIEFFRDPRYPRYWRLVLVLLFVVLAISFPYWGLNSEYRAQFPNRLLDDRVALLFFAIDYILFLIPLGTFYYMVTIDLIVWGAWLLGIGFNYLISAHDPFPKKHLRELALEPIPVGATGKKWRLAELPAVEIETLFKWASANREGTDKRLLPTVVLFGFLAIFANTQMFNRGLDQLVNWLYRPFLSVPSTVTDLFGELLLFALMLYVVVLFIIQLLLLFRNLVTQSLIIEACVVAEYALGQNINSVQRMTMDNEGLLRRLLRHLW